MIKTNKFLSYRLFFKVLQAGLITFWLLLMVIEKALELFALF